VSQFSEAVAAAAAGTPYTVVPNKHGFDVQLDTGTAQWWELFARVKMRRSFRWRVRERSDGRTFTITDREVNVEWRAGVPSLTEPSAFGSGWNWSTLSWDGELRFQTGRIIGFSRQNIWALSDRGEIEQVVDYKFNAREGRDLIRLVAQQQGLKERQPLAVKTAWATAVAAPTAAGAAYVFHSVLPAVGH